MAKKTQFQNLIFRYIFFLSLQNSEENFYISAMFLFYVYINAITLTKDIFTRAVTRHNFKPVK